MKDETGNYVMQKAISIIENGDILEWMADQVQLIHAGDRAESKVLYISGISTSSKGHRIHPYFAGRSGKGKSNLGESVIELFPINKIVFLSYLTGKALYYLPAEKKKAMDNCILYVDEFTSSADAVGTIMAITSNAQHKPRSLATGKNKEGHRETRDLRVPDNVVVWCSSVDLPEREEFQNRFLILNPDESREADKNAIKLTTKRISMGFEGTLPESYEVAKVISRILMEKKWNVLIPYVEKIEFSTRDRRIPNFILSLIKSIAIVNQFGRATFNDLLFANIEDYKTAMKIWNKIGKQSQTKLTCKEEKILEYLPGENSMEHIKCSDVMKNFDGMARSTAKDCLERLYGKGLVNKEQEEDRWNSPFFYWKVNGVNGGLTNLNPLIKYSLNDLKKFIESFVVSCRKNKNLYKELLEKEKLDYIYASLFTSLKKTVNQKSLLKEKENENKAKIDGKPINERGEIPPDSENNPKEETEGKIEEKKVNESDSVKSVKEETVRNSEKSSHDEKLLLLLEIISDHREGISQDEIVSLTKMGRGFIKRSMFELEKKGDISMAGEKIIITEKGKLKTLESVAGIVEYSEDKKLMATS